MNTLAKTCLILTAAAALVLGPALSASATDPATPADTYSTAHWQVDNPASIWQVPQHDPIRVPTGPVVDLNAGQDNLDCGRYYQSDGYIDGAITDALIAGGLLYGPNNPAEALAYGAPGTDGNSPWQYYTSPDCVEPTCADESHQTVTTFRWVWDEATQGVVRSDTGVSVVELTEAEAIAAGCYTPPVTTPEDPTVPEPECGTDGTLACTPGGEQAWWMLPLAGLLLLGGIILVVANIMFGRVHKGRHVA